MVGFPKIILLALVIVWLILFVVACYTFEYQKFSAATYADFRQILIDKYASTIKDTNQTTDYYVLLNILENDVRQSLANNKIELYKDPLLSFNIFLGIGTSLNTPQTLSISIFVFISHFVITSILIITSLYISSKLEDLFDGDGVDTYQEVPVRNVCLEYYKQVIENKKTDIQIVRNKNSKLQVMLPYIGDQFIQPVLPTYPTLFALFLYMIAIFILSGFYCVADSEEFLQALQNISEYTNGIAFNMKTEGITWIAIIACWFTQILYFNMLWNTALGIIELCSWICCIEFSPKPIALE